MVITALSDLAESGTLGAMLSLATLFLFLRSFRRSLLIAATVPLSLCVTLGVMFFSDMSLNILSLVGLMLAIGLLVDNSVVASEAIDYRRKRESDGFTAAALGISDIGLAIAAGTLTTVIVFVPSFMTDIQQVAVIPAKSCHTPSGLVASIASHCPNTGSYDCCAITSSSAWMVVIVGIDSVNGLTALRDGPSPTSCGCYCYRSRPLRAASGSTKSSTST